MPILDPSTKRQKHARAIYTRLNKRYFSGKLPKSTILIVAPGKLGCASWGDCEWDQAEEPVLVRIGEACWGIDANNAFLRSVILHEQMHLALGATVNHDSPEWKAEALRLSKLGAFVETI